MIHALREALAAFRRAPLLTALSAAMIGLSLLVVGLFGVATWNVSRVLDEVESRVEIVAYLRDSASPAAVTELQEALAERLDVGEVFYVSREQALQNARRDMSEFDSIFATLDANPLPASLEIRMVPEYRDADGVRGVAAAAGESPIVEDVRYGADWLDKIFLLRRVAGAASIVLGTTFGLVAALIIGAAVRISIFARREEIEIMHLVGAADRFIRGPFLLEGLFTGILGGVAALGATFIVYRILSGRVVQLAWIPPDWVAGGLVAGALLGMAASAFAVRRYLRTA
ncbi:MAG TPA: permease-like cell division protein FtsX [Longimicrobiales bacterium]|nr:permease-like cell division protein FtsX [Longimicrobiales bacterium]